MAAFPKQEVVKFQARPPAYGLVTDARKGKDGPLLRLKATIWIIELAPGLRTTSYNEARFFTALPFCDHCPDRFRWASLCHCLYVFDR